MQKCIFLLDLFNFVRSALCFILCGNQLRPPGEICYNQTGNQREKERDLPWRCTVWNSSLSFCLFSSCSIIACRRGSAISCCWLAASRSMSSARFPPPGMSSCCWGPSPSPGRWACLSRRGTRSGAAGPCWSSVSQSIWRFYSCSNTALPCLQVWAACPVRERPCRSSAGSCPWA